MIRNRRRLLLLAIAIAAIVPTSSAAAPRPLQTAVVEPPELTGPTSDLAFRRLVDSGATAVRTTIPWYAIAPASPDQLKDPTDWRDPAYTWEEFDAKLRSFRTHGLEPIVALTASPPWSRIGSNPASPPAPHHLRAFMTAAAERYSGRVPGVPRVRYWQLWIEPNLSIFFYPQFVGRRPASPRLYRDLLAAFSPAVYAARADNVVIAGATAPFRDITEHTQAAHKTWGPLTFMRELLCLDAKLRRKCRQRLQFDIWAHHPYTSGGPTRSAVLPDDVSIGDLPDMQKVLRAGIKAGNVVTKHRPTRLWVTEFSWDSSPPDPGAVPARLHTRWVAEGLYRMWTHGVTLVAWLQLRDEPVRTSYFQSGLWYRGATFERDRPKPALAAFRFPLVAFGRSGGVYVWGRTPAGRQARVLVEQSFGGGWKRLGVVRTNKHGIFERRFAVRATGFVRARTLDRNERAVPFSLRRVPDRFFNPFGLPTLLEPPKRP